MRSKIILVLALVMGIITTSLFFNYMQQFNTEAVVNESLVEVVVAKNKIFENQIITADMLKVTEVPTTGLHPQAITEIAEIVGKYTTATIEIDEVVLSHRLMTDKEESMLISRKVQEGNRAVAIGTNFVRSVSNLIEPEDYVDVIFTEVVKQEGKKDEIVSKQILSKVRVLAVGRKMVEKTNPNEEYVEYSSITFELNPKDAVTVINASERGVIHLTLHSRILPQKDPNN